MAIQMLALKAFDFQGRAIAPLERFDADPANALALRYAHRAIFAPKDEPASNATKTSAVKPKRKYHRRDMTAED
jgi:hypothetical protein